MVISMVSWTVRHLLRRGVSLSFESESELRSVAVGNTLYSIRNRIALGRSEALAVPISRLIYDTGCMLVPNNTVVTT
jgi:hypothetical protein